MKGIHAAVLLLLGAAVLDAAPRTIRGELVDVRCAVKDAKNSGEDHADCALSCAKRGATMGILTDEGIYTIAGEYTSENNRKLIALVAKPVEATGEVTEKDGTKVITATSIQEAR